VSALYRPVHDALARADGRTETTAQCHVRQNAALRQEESALRLKDGYVTGRQPVAGKSPPQCSGVELFVWKVERTARAECAANHPRAWRASVDAAGRDKQTLAGTILEPPPELG
jgi:hypothetical protein